jgi:IstB-like ATP binding protein
LSTNSSTNGVAAGDDRRPAHSDVKGAHEGWTFTGNDEIVYGACGALLATDFANREVIAQTHGGCSNIGMLPVGQDAAEAFYRIVDTAYERRSIAVTSNIQPSGFDTIMPRALATATVDRLLHHAHLVTTQGDSHRLQQALAGKGVKTLT